jgi:lactate dehydrogenase-like 2-hydroxyacid dehydrogenase
VSAPPRVMVTRRLPEPVEAMLRERFDARLSPGDRPLSAAELAEGIRTADALLPTVTDRLTAEVLSAAPRRARIVANFGAGYDNIDLAAARAAGIAVTNTPDVLTDCTADAAIALLLAVARRVGEGERHVRAGAWTGWRPTHMLGTRVTGKTLGIVGMGRIGRAVARRARGGFAMRIIYWAPRPVDDPEIAELGAERRETLDDLLAASDFVSLHAPSTPETRHLIDAARLARMRRGAVLINTARGGLVDEAALVEALRAGTIAGAGLDVYEAEPSLAPGLAELENAVLLPHLGSATTEARVAMGERAVQNLSAFFGGRPPPDRVA